MPKRGSDVQITKDSPDGSARFGGLDDDTDPVALVYWQLKDRPRSEQLAGFEEWARREYRGAEEQAQKLRERFQALQKEGEQNGSMSKRATDAQMARRKIATPKGRPGGLKGTPLHSTTFGSGPGVPSGQLQQQTQQLPLPSFGSFGQDAPRNGGFNFAFGAATQAPPAPNFATPPASSAPVQNGGFSFGAFSQGQQQQSQPNGTLSFGTPAPSQSSNPFGSLSTSFTFGQPQATQAQQQTTPFATGTQSFGGQPSSTTGTSFNFGQPPSQSAPTQQPSSSTGAGFTFGQPPSQATQEQQTTQSSGGQPASSTSSFTFGQPPNQAKPGQTSSTTGAGFTFGQPPSQTTPAQQPTPFPAKAKSSSGEASSTTGTSFSFGQPPSQAMPAQQQTPFASKTQSSAAQPSSTTGVFSFGGGLGKQSTAENQQSQPLVSAASTTSSDVTQKSTSTVQQSTPSTLFGNLGQSFTPAKPASPGFNFTQTPAPATSNTTSTPSQPAFSFSALQTPASSLPTTTQPAPATSSATTQKPASSSDLAQQASPAPPTPQVQQKTSAPAKPSPPMASETQTYVAPVASLEERRQWLHDAYNKLGTPRLENPLEYQSEPVRVFGAYWNVDKPADPPARQLSATAPVTLAASAPESPAKPKPKSSTIANLPAVLSTYQLPYHELTNKEFAKFTFDEKCATLQAAFKYKVAMCEGDALLKLTASFVDTWNKFVSKDESNVPSLLSNTSQASSQKQVSSTSQASNTNKVQNTSLYQQIPTPAKPAGGLFAAGGFKSFSTPQPAANRSAPSEAPKTVGAPMGSHPSDRFFSMTSPTKRKAAEEENRDGANKRARDNSSANATNKRAASPTKANNTNKGTAQTPKANVGVTQTAGFTIAGAAKAKKSLADAPALTADSNPSSTASTFQNILEENPPTPKATNMATPARGSTTPAGSPSKARQTNSDPSATTATKPARSIASAAPESTSKGETAAAANAAGATPAATKAPSGGLFGFGSVAPPVTQSAPKTGGLLNFNELPEGLRPRKFEIPKELENGAPKEPLFSNFLAPKSTPAPNATLTPSGPNSGSVLNSPNLQPMSGSSNIFGHISDADAAGDDDSDINDDALNNGSEEDWSEPELNADQDEVSSDENEDEDESEAARQPSILKKRSKASGADEVTSDEEAPPPRRISVESRRSSAEGIAIADSMSKSASKSRSPPNASKGGLFARLSYDKDGNPERDLSESQQDDSTPKASRSNIFGAQPAPATQSMFFNLNNAPAGDQTWHPETPIKFSQSTNSNSGGNSAAPQLYGANAVAAQPLFMPPHLNQHNRSPSPMQVCSPKVPSLMLTAAEANKENATEPMDVEEKAAATSAPNQQTMHHRQGISGGPLVFGSGSPLQQAPMAQGGFGQGTPNSGGWAPLQQTPATTGAFGQGTSPGGWGSNTPHQQAQGATPLTGPFVNAGSTNATPAPGGFQWPTAPTAPRPSIFLQGPPTNEASRATTPGASSAAGTGMDTDDAEADAAGEPDPLNDPQKDLMAEGHAAIEAANGIKAQSKVAAYVLKPPAGWTRLGTGQAYLLEDKQSGVHSIRLLADGLGRVLLNERVSKQNDFKVAKEKQVTFVLPGIGPVSMRFKEHAEAVQFVAVWKSMVS